MQGDHCTGPRIISLSPLSLATDLTDETLGVSGLWLGTRTGAGGTATLTESFFLAAAHGSIDNRSSLFGRGRLNNSNRISGSDIVVREH